MANSKDALKIVYGLEFSNKDNVLEKNATEDGWTFMGIYQKAHQELDLWKIIRQKLQQYDGDTKLVGRMMYDNELVRNMVDTFYKKEFWDKARLDEVVSQQVANEIFVFGVNAGMKKAVTIAQRIVGVPQDGIMGEQTLKALNNFNEQVFDDMYDLFEQDYYSTIIISNPSKKIFANGWRNRSVAV